MGIETPICKLCLQSQATQANSHVFPRFLINSIRLTKTGKNKLFKKDRQNKGDQSTNVQDGPKENFIFCPKCEIYFSRIEDKVARFFYKPLIEKRDLNQLISLVNSRGFEYYTDAKIDYQTMKVFFYTLFFRSFLSKDGALIDIHSSPEDEETLRIILQSEVPFKDMPTYVLFCKDIVNPTGNIIYGSYIFNRSYLLFINEFIVLQNFDIDDMKTIKSPGMVCNYNDTEFKIALLSKHQWEITLATLRTLSIRASK